MNINLTQRLLGVMQYGFNIYNQDGHRYILLEPNFTHNSDLLQSKMDSTGLIFISKVYGSYIDALDRIDNFLQALGLESTSTVYIDFGGNK